LIKIIFTIIILSLTSIYADRNELISKDIMKTKLINILENVKKYKEKTENEKKQLQERVNRLQEEFKQYKAKKQREIAKINTQLRITRRKLLKNKKKLRISQKKQKVIHQKIVQKKSIPKKRVPKKKVIHEKAVYTNIIPKKNTPLPVVKNLPWVEIVVEDNINIYQLALRYYGDRDKYREIYAANQHIIGKNFKIYNGMSLKIPMTNQFEEQPMILNRD